MASPGFPSPFRAGIATFVASRLHALSSRRIARSTGASLAVHLLTIAILIGYSHRRPVRVFSLPGTQLGAHVTVVYLPGRAPAPVHHSAAKIRAAAQFTPAKTTSTVPASTPLPSLASDTLTSAPDTPTVAKSSPPSSAPDQIQGSDSWGNGNVQIAFTTYSPSPAPDLSGLPHGMQGDVVLDVTINAQGKVSDLAVLKTLGYGIESSVMNTVRTWTFRPATKDGVPIASVQELHFHYGPV